MISMTWPQFERRECEVDGRCVRLTKGEIRFLLPLLMNRRMWTRDDLMEAVYPIEEYDDRQPYDKIIDVYICKLRKKLGRQHIEVIWGRGYRLTQCPPSIRELTQEPVASIMPAVETTTQETEYNGQEERNDRLQDDAEAGSRHEEHLRLQERIRRRPNPVALYRQERVYGRCAEDDHGFGRRGLTSVQRRRLERRVRRLLRIYPYLAPRSKHGEDLQIEEAGQTDAG